LKDKLTNVIKLRDGKELPQNFDSIMASPKIDDPMYAPLERLSKDYILPGIGELDNNIVFLMEENRRFMESYMVGLNHEMGLELVWREFPTDQRGTIFSYFWDSTRLEETSNGKLVPPKDIDEVHSWKNNLGGNKGFFPQDSSGTSDNYNTGQGEPNIVLVIRGDVIRRYPDLIIYALKSGGILNPNDTNFDINDLTGMELSHPLFRARLGSDILIVGFDITLTMANASNYYFVLQENQDLPVFGLDLTSTVGSSTGGSANNLSWEDPLISSNMSKSGYINKFDPNLFSNDGISSPTSASIAVRTYQLPFRILMHADTLLPSPADNSSNSGS
jgi:hypothetical protein